MESAPETHLARQTLAVSVDVRWSVAPGSPVRESDSMQS